MISRYQRYDQILLKAELTK